MSMMFWVMVPLNPPTEMRLRSSSQSGIFKAHGLHGPSEYLYRLQSWWAIRLLTRTHHTLGKIARTCGFASGSSFFRNWLGLSPADVRRGVPYTRRPTAPADA